MLTCVAFFSITQFQKLGSAAELDVMNLMAHILTRFNDSALLNRTITSQRK